VTDDSGRARVPCAAGEVLVFAVSATLLGGQRETIDVDRPVLLTIGCNPTQFLRARVVDASGRPQVGVPVVAVPVKPQWLEPALGGTSHGSDGVAELGPMFDKSREGWVLHVFGVFPKALGVKLDAHPLTNEPTTVVLPPHGTLEVRLLDSGGRRYLGPAEVDLESISEEITLATDDERQVEIGSGQARFERVGLGLGLGVSVEIPGLQDKLGVEGSGPRREGELAVIEVVVPASHHCFAGRALDADRHILRFRELRIEWTADCEAGALDDVRFVHTDREGRFTFLGDPQIAHALRATCLVSAESGKHSIGAMRSIDPRTSDLGTWILEPPGLLATGRILDDQGSGLARVDLSVADPEPRLAIARGTGCSTDDSGAFELRGWCTEPSLELEFWLLGSRLVFPGVVARGSKDLVFRVP